MEHINKIKNKHYQFLANSLGFNKKFIDNYFNNLKNDEQIKFLFKIDNLIKKDNIIRQTNAL